MNKEEQKRREEELDRFWNIDDLIPAKRNVIPTRADVEAVEIVVDAKKEKTEAASSKISSQTRFIPPHTPTEHSQPRLPDLEYTPEDSLISTVRIFRQKSNYAYYEGFVADALRLYNVQGRECEHVPFFSYVPQYSQMRREQLEWYLWWRECFRQGNCLTTDYSYLLLYVYEILNLGTRIDVASGQEALCRLWLHYREIFHQLDTYLPEWICDYSLIHCLPPPTLFETRETHQAMLHCTLKEFYIPAGEVEGIVRGLIVFASNYDYSKSKFYKEDTKALFNHTIASALKNVFLKMGGKSGGFFEAGAAESGRLVRNAFANALCAASNKYKIAVEYTSLSCSQSIRYLITDVIKYTENCIRAHLGIRARLGIYALPQNLRKTVENTCLTLSVRPANQTHKVAEAAEELTYAHLYDTPRKPLSLSGAAAIEQSSWDTTRRLIEAFGDAEAPPDAGPCATIPLPSPQAPTERTESAIPVRYHLFLRAVMGGKAEEVRAAARSMGKMADAILDEINECVADTLGDILLEENNGEISIIEDYLVWAKEQLTTGKDE